MKSIDITISFPQSNAQRKKTKQVLEKVAEILADKLTEIDGNPWMGETQTVADKLGISDSVVSLYAGKHIVEIDL